MKGLKCWITEFEILSVNSGQPASGWLLSERESIWHPWPLQAIWVMKDDEATVGTREAGWA